MKRGPRGQGISEYSICLAVFLAAFLGMQIYIKRGLQGRYKDVMNNATKESEQIAQSQVPGIEVPWQYEPYYQNLTIRTSEHSYANMTLSAGGIAGKEVPAGSSATERSFNIYEGP